MNDYGPDSYTRMGAALNAMQRAFEQVYGVSDLKTWLEALEEQRHQGWLIDWLDPDQWRCHAADAIGSVADALNALADWISPD